MNIAVIYGSCRGTRKGIRTARFIVAECKKRGHDVTLIDPAEYQLPMLDKMYKEYEPGTALEPIEKVAKILIAADGYIIVSGEYNHGIPPALKNLLDHFQQEYFFKPSALVTYSAGIFGGARVQIHLRDVLAELGMPAIPTVAAFPKVQETFDEDGVPDSDATVKRSQKMLDEFEWYLRAFKNERDRGVPY